MACFQTWDLFVLRLRNDIERVFSTKLTADLFLPVLRGRCENANRVGTLKTLELVLLLPLAFDIWEMILIPSVLGVISHNSVHGKVL